jgi:hypothetical protein
VAYGGWWVRIGYLADQSTQGEFRIGDLTYRLALPRGLHAVYLDTRDEAFDQISMSVASPDVTLCTDDVTVGRPEPMAVNR